LLPPTITYCNKFRDIFLKKLFSHLKSLIELGSSYSIKKTSPWHPALCHSHTTIKAFDSVLLDVHLRNELSGTFWNFCHFIKELGGSNVY
jgi:hypothetical protein